jgi:hypothetical protein
MSTTTRQMTTEIGRPSHPMARTVLRTDDPTRVPLALRSDDHEKPRASSADTRLRTDIPPSKRTDNADADTPNRDGATTPVKPDLLTLEETIELFRQKVTDAQQDTQNALAGSEDVSDVVRPKLTLDLGHSKIARLPESVVDLIKIEVERLSLSHNQIWHIPLRFADCSQLRYLNIRTNVFREIPRGVRLDPLTSLFLLIAPISCTSYHFWRFSTSVATRFAKSLQR